MPSSVVDVIATEGEGFVNLATVVRGDCDSTDVMDVKVFECDELGEMVSLLANSNAG